MKQLKHAALALTLVLIAGCRLVPGHDGPVNTESEQALVAKSKTYMDNSKSMDAKYQEAAQAVKAKQAPLIAQLQSQSLSLSADLKKDSRYAARIGAIEVLQKQINDANTSKQAELNQALGSVNQQNQALAVEIEALAEVVRKENHWLGKEWSYDVGTQKWTKAAAPVAAAKK